MPVCSAVRPTAKGCYGTCFPNKAGKQGMFVSHGCSSLTLALRVQALASL